MIGLVLGVVSLILAYESKGLLIGEGVDRKTLSLHHSSCTLRDSWV